jgi:EAL domain-containing protein (putative c-di-GMP-specific phosphodiesterase class I)
VAALQGMGCRYGQGWRFGRPMDEAALLAMFKAAYQR